MVSQICLLLKESHYQIKLEKSESCLFSIICDSKATLLLTQENSYTSAPFGGHLLSPFLFPRYCQVHHRMARIL
jgi:hypothetical protein